jgi:hypothetical protein
MESQKLKRLKMFKLYSKILNHKLISKLQLIKQLKKKKLNQ